MIPPYRARHAMAPLTILAMLVTGTASAQTQPRTIPTNRQWDVLNVTDPVDQRALLTQAARRLGTWRIDLAGVAVDGALLESVVETPAETSLLRTVRERLKRPIDLEDFLYFLDDLLVAGEQGLWGQPVWVTAPRARDAGIFVHPVDVFGGGEPRRYGVVAGVLNIDEPARPPSLPPAADGDPLGPNWSARYPNPEKESELLDALRTARPDTDFDVRVAKLIGDLRVSGADVYLTSTARRRERGYLMWGAFELSRLKGAREVQRWCDELDRINRRWSLNIPIRWLHPDGWRATIEEARRMADAYDVVYATKRGARTSDHYDGVAVDVTVVGLPASLDLVAPDGARAHFDLSAPDEPRDLSLTPKLITWVEQHFGLRKLKLDYPHWSDVQVRDTP